jgi:nucleoside-diphosphate-sugar epimerase
MPTAVVTGGAGFLGSHLCDYLHAQGVVSVCVAGAKQREREAAEAAAPSQGTTCAPTSDEKIESARSKAAEAGDVAAAQSSAHA